MKRTRKLTVFGIALICAILLSLLFLLGVFSNIQLKLSDNLYGGKTALNTIVLVSIDDKSLQEIGRWPWHRENFAHLIDRLHDAKVVGIDVAFFEKSDPGNDSLLGSALEKAGNVVIPVEYTSFETVNGKIVGKELLKPIEELEGRSDVAYINIITDRDGVTRAANFDVSDEYENFASVVYKEYWSAEIPERYGKNPRFMINFVGSPGSFERFSFTDVINDRVSGSAFKDKLVLVGATAPDLHDDYFVPTSEGKAMPGVEIHANTIQTMITQSFLQKQPAWSVVLLIFVFALFMFLLKYYVNILKATIAALIMILAYVVFAIKMFDYGMIMNLVYIPVTIAVTYVAVVLYFYISERKKKKMILGAFGKYVSPLLIDEIMKDPDKLKLGGERRDITIFFSDIRGFTSISEKLKPEQLVNLLNEYLTEMTDIVMKSNGVVDKFMGDAIMAFWNAPIDQPNHAKIACQVSLDMIKRLKEMQKKWTEEGVPALEIGIGLNTGHAVVGNMGSYDRFDYTAMGDNINLGSRLEGLNKPYGTTIILSEKTKKRVDRAFATRKLDFVAVKGKKEPITIYELVCRKKDLKPDKAKLIEHYEKGLELYKKKRWDSAVKEFEKSLTISKTLKSDEGKEDLASEVFIDRCKEFRKNPPPKDWDGAWIMKTK